MRAAHSCDCIALKMPGTVSELAQPHLFDDLSADATSTETFPRIILTYLLPCYKKGFVKLVEISIRQPCKTKKVVFTGSCGIYTGAI